MRDIDSWMTVDFQANFIEDIVDVAWGFMSMLVMGKVMDANIEHNSDRDLNNGGLAHFCFSTIKSQTMKDMAFELLMKKDESKKKSFIMLYNEMGQSVGQQIQKGPEAKATGKPMEKYKFQTSRGKKFFIRTPGKYLIAIAPKHTGTRPKVFSFQLPPADSGSTDPARKMGNAIIVVNEDGDIHQHGLEDWEMVCEEVLETKNQTNSNCSIKSDYADEQEKKEKDDDKGDNDPQVDGGTDDTDDNE